ncbi:hypothetical protein H5410_054643 [Solanum commersonii]|uniref:Uncharacterized protein n=1 Tax=Solanum commersonii TaxID=4109 RepID=A0A9J5WGC9_SOLCO|nr:hypothetical protein H5410_054643 [Solanum commersonii]
MDILGQSSLGVTIETPPNTIWKRLDRLAYKNHWFDMLTLLNILDSSIFGLNMMTFSMLYPLQVLHKKLKATIKALSAWSRVAYRNFHEEPKRLENIIKGVEERSMNRINLSKAKTKFTRFLKIQEKVLSQKARIKWLENSDTNSAFFHRVIKDKIKKFSIHKIKDQEGNLVEGTTQITDAAVNFFTNLFKAESIEEASNIFNLVERAVTIEDNNNLNNLPTLQEIKDTIFSID